MRIPTLEDLILFTPDVINLQSCKIKNPELYQKVKLILVPRLLQLVVEGKQDKAEELLKASPDLCLEYGKVMNLSGRNFKNISAFRYALWAKDRHMWMMLLNYMPKEIAFEQLQEHETNGVSYELEGRIAHEKHYDFSLLIGPLQEYVDYLMGRELNLNPDDLDRIWCQTIGKAQCYVPVHVANEYLREDRSFDPRTATQFKEDYLPRTLLFYNWVDFNYYSWFEYSGMGSNFSVCRGQDDRGAIASGCVRGHALFDLLGIKKLWEIRTKEYSKNL